MIPYANIFPKQVEHIPWGWKNKTTPAGTFVAEPAGIIRMPKLVQYFDWSTYTVEDYDGYRPFGTRNMKSVFTTASRFLGMERLLVEQPDLSAITEGFLFWNAALLQRWRYNLHFFHIADDFASKDALFMQPDLWRTWLAPEYLKLTRFAKESGLAVIFHSDGDISEVLDDLARLCVDALDFQPVGKMKKYAEEKSYRSMGLYVNEADEQARTNEVSMALQRGTV